MRRDVDQREVGAERSGYKSQSVEAKVLKEVKLHTMRAILGPLLMDKDSVA
jgi:hypothetical protein